LVKWFLRNADFHWLSAGMKDESPGCISSQGSAELDGEVPP
jgi:hypothetical protein